MADEKSKGSLLPVSGVAVLLAALGITVFTQTPYKAPRPAVPVIRESCEKVDARLWQDPFSAVVEHAKLMGSDKFPSGVEAFSLYTTPCKNATAGFTGETLAARINKCLEKRDGKVTVLGVMDFGTRNEEETETRTRNRYAVLSGLSRLGFTPGDPEHLEYLRIKAKNCQCEDKISLSNIMPFEWLASSKKENDAVLLIWINDQVFQERPLAMLNSLADSLGLRGKPKASVSFKVLGPAGTTTLKKMLEEMASVKPPFNEDLLRDVEIYSPFATADENILRDDKNLTCLSQNKIEDVFKQHGVTFSRTIGSDKELTDKLVGELSLRKVTPMTDKHHILLVAEWDTDYGRSLPEIFTRSLSEKAPSGQEEVRKRVHTISYMRGIDGRLPGENEDKKEEKTNAKPAPEEEMRKLEQPVGKSQFDYLRRLADNAFLINQELKADKKGTIRAIGILGSDFYDKYLVLQALRQRFPEAIFFTTDLDARFFHPDYVKWTRNLIVASSFDLALRKDDTINLQGHIPPFRYSYQTSAYYATLCAFADGQGTYLDQTADSFLLQHRHRPSPPPCVFEIGRHKAVNLSNTDNSIHPTRDARKRQRQFMFGTSIIIALLAFLFLFTSMKARDYAEAVWNYYRPLKFGRLVVTAASGITVLVACYLVYACHASYEEEPFSLFEGISVWPSELIRLVAAVVAISFICKAWKDIRKNKESIGAEFFGEIDNPPGSDDKQKKIRSLFDNIRDKFNNNTGISRFVEMARGYCRLVKFDWEVPRGDCTVDITKLWYEYVRRDTETFRILRLLPTMLVFLILCTFIIRSSGFPVKPIRGPISYNCDTIILIVSVVSFIALVFYVFDVTLICRQFIANASDNRPRWRDATGEQDAGESWQAEKREIRKEAELAKCELNMVQLIARRTDAVGKLIFYPFIVLFLMFLARFNYFDNWQTPLGLAAVFCLSAAYAWSCAVFLRRAAENARMDALRRLNKNLEDTIYRDDPNGRLMMQIKFAINEISAIREGAFLPFMQHPAVQALFVPFGGVGGVYLLDFLTKMNV